MAASILYTCTIRFHQAMDIAATTCEPQCPYSEIGADAARSGDKEYICCRVCAGCAPGAMQCKPTVAVQVRPAP
ncbi:hypothetical protein [uncultured Treponema sp.]|uniref:hypothetical protein n=1 Tax=uncultured Treponema sp. TaxID=162155 RepID=UPI0025E03153|nr:hypothetical protein [uncultured Treponema sp.]